MFRAAGYSTHMYDNQYFVGGSVNFLSNKNLSKLMFDTRNDKRFYYDGDAVDSIKLVGSPALYVIHLWGQHFDYSQRFPRAFNRFRAADYDKDRWDEHQRTLIAQYDNATLYNDYVLKKIIEKLKDTNTIVFYLSDHGEEVFEVRNHNGHGDAEYSPDLKYQIRIPFMVWASKSYRETHKQLWNVLKEKQHARITSDDFSHILFDVAKIRTKYFDPRRSFINANFDSLKHRMVLKGVDYDAVSK